MLCVPILGLGSVIVRAVDYDAAQRAPADAPRAHQPAVHGLEPAARPVVGHGHGQCTQPELCARRRRDRYGGGAAVRLEHDVAQLEVAQLRQGADQPHAVPQRQEVEAAQGESPHRRERLG